MSRFETLPVEVLSILYSFISDSGMHRVMQCSRGTSVAIAEVLVDIQDRAPWKLVFGTYLRARYAVGMHVYNIIREFDFVRRLSRACRCCGCPTQRVVLETPLCCSCTRNQRNRCWMVPLSVAQHYGVADHIFRHQGARVPLVFAEHIELLTSRSRRDLVMHMNLPWKGRT